MSAHKHKPGARSRRVIPLYLVTLCLAVALEVLNLAFLGPFAAPAAQTNAGALASPYPYTDVNPYGANAFLSKEVEDWKREKTVQMMADAGLGWIKQQFSWTEIEPKQGRYWDDKYNQNSWDKYDKIVGLAEKYGLRVIARLDDAPAWAGGTPGTDVHTPPTDPETFADFAATFVQHYQGRVQYLQIWNEPNLKSEWGGKIDAAAYARLLCLTYQRTKAVDPNVVILTAPLAQTLETGDRGLDELDYLQQLYDDGIRGCYDILLANGYGFDQPPDAAPSPQTLNFRRVELVRQVMERNGEAAKPVWLNEYGWDAPPADFPPDKLFWSRVTPDQQARYTVDGIQYARQHWPWVGVINIWYFRQVGDIPPDDASFYFRMVDVEFSPQPVYRAVQRATAAQRLAQPGRYGVLDPAVGSRGQWATLTDEQAGALAIRSDHPGDQLTIHFHGNQLALTAERGPQGGRLQVVIDNSPTAAAQLPRDDRRRRYVDLRAASRDVTTIPVVSGLDGIGPPQDHTAVLTVLPAADGKSAGQVTITGVEVSYVRSTLPFALFSAVVGLVVLIVAALIVRAIRRLRRGPAGG